MRWWRWFYTVPLRLRSLFRRRDVERELDEEIEFHLERRIDAHLSQGLSPQAARQAALRAMGGVTQRKEECRDMRRVNFVEDLARDLHYAARMLRKSPGFTAVAVLSLALGIGANTAVFSLVNAVLLRALPVNRPERLVVLRPVDRGGFPGYFAYPDYRRLREQNQVFSGVLAASRLDRLDVELGARTTQVQGEIVSGNYFSVLGVPAALGHTFSGAEERQPVAVVSYRFWKREFGGDRAIPGRGVTIQGVRFTITGVAPVGFSGEAAGAAPDIWVPAGVQPLVYPIRHELRNDRSVEWLDVMGRLKDGATIEQARANAGVLVAQLHAELGNNAPYDYLQRLDLQAGGRGTADLREKFSESLLTLMAVVGLVLLAACTNVASLLLARAAARQREMATRLAIGATRGRLFRQVVTESVLLATLGGAAGLLFAAWGGTILVALVNVGGDAVSLDLRPDARILLFTAAAAAFTGVLFGLAPALDAVRAQLAPMLRTGARSLAGGRRRWGLRDALLAAQVGLALVMVAGGGLFIRTLWNLKTLDAGFRADHVLLASLDSQWDAFPRPQLASLAARLMERTAAIPGVQSASVSYFGSMADGGGNICCVQTEGYTPRARQDQQARMDYVGPGYFRTLGIPLVAGREFSPGDTAGAPAVAIVNQTMARHFFGRGSAVGRRFRLGKGEFAIVGVAADSKYRDLREATPRLVYFAFLQDPHELNTLAVRTAGTPRAFAGAVRETIRETAPGLRITEITTLSGRIDRKLVRERLLADLSGFFSGLTLLLVSIGIYGALAYAVARRTNEIGIRMALGAQRGAVLWMVLRDILLVLSAGVAGGIAGVLALGRLVESMLFGLKPADAATLALATALLTAVALAAGYVPARRASRVDPVAALRFE